MSIGHPELSVGAPSGPSSQGLKEPGQTPHHSTRRAAFQKLVPGWQALKARFSRTFPKPSPRGLEAQTAIHGRGDQDHG